MFWVDFTYKILQNVTIENGLVIFVRFSQKNKKILILKSKNKGKSLLFLSFVFFYFH